MVSVKRSNSNGSASLRVIAAAVALEAVGKSMAFMVFRESRSEYQLDTCFFDDLERQVEILTPAIKHTAVEFRIESHDPAVLVLDQEDRTRRTGLMGHVDSTADH